MPRMIGVGPGEDLPLAEGIEVAFAPDAPPQGQQVRQRRAARQPAPPAGESEVHVLPGDPWLGLPDRPRIPFRPATGPPMVVVGPGEDLPHGQAREVVDIPHPALGGEEPGERRAAGEAAPTITQGAVHGTPADAAHAGDLAVRLDRPIAGTLVPGVGPGEDLVGSEGHAGDDRDDAALGGQQAGERGAGGQASAGPAQGVVHRLPGDHVGPGDGPGIRRRPVARPLVPGVGPREDLRDREPLPLGIVSAAAVGEETGEGPAARKAAQAEGQRRLDGQPGLARRLGDRPGPPRRPLGGACMVGVGPSEDLVLGQVGRLAPFSAIVVDVVAQEGEPMIRPRLLSPPVPAGPPPGGLPACGRRRVGAVASASHVCASPTCIRLGPSSASRPPGGGGGLGPKSSGSAGP